MNNCFQALDNIYSVDHDLEIKKVKWLSHVHFFFFFATPWTVVCQAPPPMGFSRQEFWSGLPFPSPEDLPDPEIEPGSPMLQGDSLSSEPPGKPQIQEDIKKQSQLNILSCFLPADTFQNKTQICGNKIENSSLTEWRKERLKFRNNEAIEI